MSTHVISIRTDASNTGSWAAVAAAWPTNTWDGDSGSQAVAAVGVDQALTFLEIDGGPLNDNIIPLDATVDDIQASFTWQVFLTAGNSLIVVETLGGTFDTVTGDASGSLSRSLGGSPGTWQDVVDAHVQIFGWSFQRNNLAQAGGFARIVISNFALLITYHGGTPSVIFSKLPPVPGRVPVLQGGGLG